MTSGVQLVQQLQYRHQGVHQQVAEKSPFSYINYCSLLKYKCVDIINSLYRLIEERLHRNSYKNGDPVTTATTSTYLNTMRPGYNDRIFAPRKRLTLQVPGGLTLHLG